MTGSSPIDPPGDLLGCELFQGQLDHDFLVGQGLAHVQHGPRDGQDGAVLSQAKNESGIYQAILRGAK